MGKCLFFIMTIISLVLPNALYADELSVSFGGMLISRPEYEGAEESDLDLFPYFDISLGKIFFFNAQNGLGFYLVNEKYFKFGGSLGYYESRDEEDSDKLRGFGDVDAGIDGRLFGTLILGKYFLSFKLRKDLSENHDGTLIDLGMGYRLVKDEWIQWNLELNATHADENYMKTYFGVSTLQASQSGLNSFVAQGGFKNIAIRTDFKGEFFWDWSFMVLAEYKRLLEDAANSPLVKDVGSENQFQIGVGLVYHF